MRIVLRQLSFWTTLIFSFSASQWTFGASAPSSAFRLVTTWAGAGSNHEIKGWSVQELSHSFKKTISRERDPATGKVVKWEGVLLSSLVDKALESLPIEGRAQVDLIVLHGQNGRRALLPRAFVSKYPVLLAFQGESLSNGVESDGRGPIYSVVPWSSKPRVMREDLPLESFFVSKVTRVEFTNYRDQYNSLYLKRRTDPSAMRGEKLFVQNCVSCHTGGQGPSLSGIVDERGTQKFALTGHPPIKAGLKLTERDRQSIIRYLNAHREENPVSMTQATHSARAPAQKKD
jgi:mono/diheme cytochrome c family protein